MSSENREDMERNGGWSSGAAQGLIVYPHGKQKPSSGGWWSAWTEQRRRTTEKTEGEDQYYVHVLTGKTNCVQVDVTVREISSKIQVHTVRMFWLNHCLVYKLTHVCIYLSLNFQSNASFMSWSYKKCLACLHIWRTLFSKPNNYIITSHCL